MALQAGDGFQGAVDPGLQPGLSPAGLAALEAIKPRLLTCRLRTLMAGAGCVGGINFSRPGRDLGLAKRSLALKRQAILGLSLPGQSCGAIGPPSSWASPLAPRRDKPGRRGRVRPTRVLAGVAVVGPWFRVSEAPSPLRFPGALHERQRPHTRQGSGAGEGVFGAAPFWGRAPPTFGGPILFTEPG